MIMGRFSVRRVLLLSATGLSAIVLGGGALLASVESASLFEGIWLAFNVITTVGLGPGPATAAGQLMSMGLFMVAVTCWFGILVSVIEVANMRMQKQLLVEEALRPLARRPKSRLFHVN